MKIGADRCAPIRMKEKIAENCEKPIQENEDASCNLTFFWCSNEMMHSTHTVYYAGKRVLDTSLPAGSSCSVQAPGLWIRWRDSSQRSQTLDAVQRFLAVQDSSIGDLVTH